jgi:hypothetical protein
MPRSPATTRRPSTEPVGRTEPRTQEPPQRYPRSRVTVSLVISCLGVLYALYRGYYGFGGTVGMFGRPTDQAEWRAINLAGATILLVLAMLPIVALPLWQRPRLRPVLLAMCWVLAVGLTMHGLIDDTQRVLSLTGVLHLHYSFFTTVNGHAADIQDLAFNETWFMERYSKPA